LDTSLFNGFQPVVGNSFMIINNQPAGAVVSSFANLPEGGTFTSQGVTYRISYVGGDGNDVVLTVTNVDAAALAAATKAPGVPNTGLKLISANPLASLGLALLVSGMLLGLARTTIRKTLA
jgi:hypothetical protein